MTMDLGQLPVLFSLFILLFGLGFTVVADPYIRRKQRYIMLTILALCLSLIVQNLWENHLFISHTHLALKNVLSAYGYSIRPVFLVLFLYIIKPNGKKWLWWMLAGINAALYCSSPFTKLCFEIRETDYFSQRGPLWFICPVISAILLAQLLLQTFICYRSMRKKEYLIPFFVVLIILTAIILDYMARIEQPVSFLTIAIAAGSVLYYIWLHLQYVREHERGLVAEQRIQIMMTQIQPHFLFNTLNTIRALYAKDPPLADRTLESFSMYLRQNLESLSRSDLVPVTKELEHTKLYAEIEVLRFPNISVEYQIQDTGFEIPALTIQPLVENAIRHGVRSKKNGLVMVSTVRETDAHRIIVQDNGIGFDLKQMESTEESHIGINNVKERLEQMCGGKMILQSEPGKGTMITMLIPEEER